MQRPRRNAGVLLLLCAVALAVAFAQRPGLATSDTKIDLHVAPARFLGDAGSMWTRSSQLGAVATGQRAGYLFPMGPFFAAGHAVGLDDWVVQRLWLAALLAIAACGVARLLAALLDSPRAAAELTGGAIAIFNPFVVTYVNRTTVSLLAYAVLPWLLLALHRGLRDERRWRWPAIVALLVAASGAGVNGAVVAWMLLGPAMLLLYELAFEGVGARAARTFIARAAPLTLLASLWWIVPAYVQSSYGVDFLRFTEQPGTVWGTTSVSEALRLMGFWLSYVGISFAGRPIPYFDDAHTMLFSAPVVAATLLLPAGALAGFALTRRRRYAPFFLALGLIGVLAVSAGFPEGTPLRHGLNFLYNHLASVRFLRGTYKAASLVAIAIACLGGAAAGELFARHRCTAVRGALALCGAAVLALAAWPLVSGRAQDRQVSYRSIPAAWRTAASALDSELPPNSRAMVLPGELFAFYRWGGTVDPILPALSKMPVAIRTEVAYSDLHATDLLWTIDGLLHQRRLLPGQLTPLLALIGVRSVITGTDDDPARSDAPPPADVAADLAAQGLGHPSQSYGPSSSFATTDASGTYQLPQVRRYDLAAARPIVRVEPVSAPLLIDGSAATLAEAAAFGAPVANRTLLYTADLSEAAVRRAAASGSEIVIGDSNRRRAFASSRLEQDTGPTLTATQSLSADGLLLDPFTRGTEAETVAVYRGISAISAPASPELPQFPEYRAFAAIDGSPNTAWLADPTLTPDRRTLQLDFQAPREVPYVDLLAHNDAGGTVSAVEIAGQRFVLRAGWNHLVLGLHHVGGLAVAIVSVTPPQAGAVASAGGISELRVPGLHAIEELRLPLDAATALRGRQGLRLTYLFERTTGDDPFQRNSVHGAGSARDVHDPIDAETQLQRTFLVPAPGSFTASAWISVAPSAPDDALDRLAGYGGPVRATSSSRFTGRPGWRASRAFDGRADTAWIASWTDAAPAWLAWHTPSPTSVRSLTLVAPREPVRRATAVQLSWPGGQTGELAVGTGGRVLLPHAIQSTSFRLTVLRAAAPSGASPADQRAVGIAEIRGIAGLGSVREGPRLQARCASASVAVGVRARTSLRATGSLAAFDAGTPLHAVPCGPPLDLAAGWAHLSTASSAAFTIDDLRLHSGSPTLAEVPSGSVLAAGHAGRQSFDGIRVSIRRPAWLVLGEGYNRGWRAWCNGHSLGTPSVIDGYANGWPVQPGCRSVRFAFAPATLANAAFAASAVGAILCLALFFAGIGRRRREPVAIPATAPLPAAAPPRPSAVRTVLVALVLGAVAAFAFEPLAGVVATPVVALLYRGRIGASAIALAAAALLAVAAPIAQLHGPGSQGGNNFGYATRHIDAHWVGVAAVVLAIGALLSTLRGRWTERSNTVRR